MKTKALRSKRTIFPNVTSRQRDLKDTRRWCDKRDLTQCYVGFSLETLFSSVLVKCVGLFTGIFVIYFILLSMFKEMHGMYLHTGKIL